MDPARATALVSRIYERWNAVGPTTEGEVLWAPDFVFDEGEAFPDGVRVEGAEAAAARLSDRGAHMGAMLVDFEAIEAVDGRRVLARLRIHIQGQGSGVPLDFPWWNVLTFDSLDRLVEMREFRSEDEARSAWAA